MYGYATRAVLWIQRMAWQQSRVCIVGFRQKKKKKKEKKRWRREEMKKTEKEILRLDLCFCQLSGLMIIECVAASIDYPACIVKRKWFSDRRKTVTW